MTSGAVAKVVRISGGGEERLMGAIQSGMLSADAVRAYKQVLSEVEWLRRENKYLEMQLQVMRRSRATERRCKIEAYRMVLAKDSEHQRSRDWRVASYIGCVALGGVAVALLTVAALL